jgi:hypothetical protein
MMPKIVIVESPYFNLDKTEVKRNVEYAQAACRDCYNRGEIPFASHLFFPQFLQDEGLERQFGIRAGYLFWTVANMITFYIDRGWSDGMKAAMERAVDMRIKFEERRVR